MASFSMNSPTCAFVIPRIRAPHTLLVISTFHKKLWCQVKDPCYYLLSSDRYLLKRNAIRHVTVTKWMQLKTIIWMFQTNQHLSADCSASQDILQECLKGLNIGPEAGNIVSTAPHFLLPAAVWAEYSRYFPTNNFSVSPTFPQRAPRALSFLLSSNSSRIRLWLVDTRCLGNSRIQ